MFAVRWLALVVALLGFCSGSLRADEPPLIIGDLLLTEMAVRFDCYFTIEECRGEGEASGVMGVELPKGFKPADRADLIKRLSKALLLVSRSPPTRHAPQSSASLTTAS